MKKIFNCLLALATLSVVAQSDSLFDRGNAFYIEGNYQKAIETYETILDSGQHSSELYFNLANSYYKQEAVAPSIYYYEKARQLAPNDADILNNLNYANNRTIDDISPMPPSFWDNLNAAVVYKLDVNQWAVLTIVLMIIGVFSFVLFLWTNRSVQKRISFVVGIMALFGMAFSLSLTFHKNNLDLNTRPAIVFERQVTLTTEPNSLSDRVIDIHEGLKVFVKEYYNDTWAKVELLDGKTGWVKTSTFRLL